MELSIPAALLAGFVATLVMTMTMRLANAAGITQMPPMELVTGSMISGNPETARGSGSSASWLVGLVIGLVHGAVVGLVFMPLMPAMRPRMSSVSSAAAAGHAGEVHLSAPGIFGSHWGAMTPVGLLAATRSTVWSPR